MRNIVFVSKKVGLLIFVIITSIFLTFAYVTLTAKISNEIKNRLPQKSALKEMVHENDKSHVTVTINKNITDQPSQINITDRSPQKKISVKIIAGEKEETRKIPIKDKFTDKPHQVHTEIECFYNDSENFLQEFDDMEPTLGKDIFFHESSCPDDITDIKLSFRQACSVESALKAHPQNG